MLPKHQPLMADASWHSTAPAGITHLIKMLRGCSQAFVAGESCQSWLSMSAQLCNIEFLQDISIWHGAGPDHGSLYNSAVSTLTECEVLIFVKVIWYCLVRSLLQALEC